MSHARVRHGITFRKMLTTVQIIYLALVAGIVLLSTALGGVMVMAPHAGEMPANVLLLAGVFTTVLCLFLGVFLPLIVFRKDPELNIAERLQRLFTAKIVLAGAFEGAALFWAILAYLLDQPLCFIGPAVAIVILLSAFPSTTKIEGELEKRSVDIEEELVELADDQ